MNCGKTFGGRGKSSLEEIKLVKKFDPWIMAGTNLSPIQHLAVTGPIDWQTTVWLMFWLNYLDRNAIVLSHLNNLEDDLNLKDSEYQTCVSIHFVG